MPLSLRFDPLGLAERTDRPEIMDSVALSEKRMRRTLRFLAMTNRRFGGAAVVLSHLKRWLSDVPLHEPIRVLDVGTGGADIPVAIAEWGRREGQTLRIIGVDMAPAVLPIALANTRAYPEIEIRCADARVLAQGDAPFHFVIGSLFLHHIPPADQVNTLRLFDQLALRGVLLSDLKRSESSLAAVSAAAFLFGNDVVRHDAPLSVRRSFRVDELNALALEAGLPYLKAQDEPWFRVSLSGKKR